MWSFIYQTTSVVSLCSTKLQGHIPADQLHNWGAFGSRAFGPAFAAAEGRRTELAAKRIILSLLRHNSIIIYQREVRMHENVGWWRRISFFQHFVVPFGLGSTHWKEEKLPYALEKVVIGSVAVAWATLPADRIAEIAPTNPTNHKNRLIIPWYEF